MQVLCPKKTPASFKGYKIAPRTVGETTVKYLLKKKEYSWVDSISFITALTTVAGFAGGGYGLLYDHFHDLKSGKNKGHHNDAKTVENKNFSEKFKAFGPSAQKQIIYVGKNGKICTEEGAKTIVPSTKTAKLGLVFAKIGIAFSGVAGIFNGISMGLPLMAAGESLNLGASPIIETPLGTGLFGIALAAIFSSRALENDPLLKMDPIKLSEKKGVFAKTKYILNNMKGCAKEVGTSAGVFGKNIGKLFSGKTRSEAVNFFKDSVFSIKPKGIMIQEFVDAEGVVKVAKTFKNNPYLMHAASLVLAVGGATLAISSVLKNKFGQKVGLKTYEVGGSLDNLSLSRYGLEKASMAGSPSAKLSGKLMGLSGVTIMAGQPGVDTKWGRGIQWIGTALLFSVFAVERKANAFKSSGAKEKFTSLIRQHSIDLTKLYTKAELAEKIGGKSRLDRIIDAIKPEEPVKTSGFFKKLLDKIVKPKQPPVKTVLGDGEKALKDIIDFAEESFEGKAYSAENLDFLKEFEKHAKAKKLNLNMENVRAAISQEGKDGNLEEIKTSLKKISDMKFEKETV